MKKYQLSSMVEVKRLAEEIEVFISRLKLTEVSFEWKDDVEQLEQLDKLESKLEELKELAAGLYADIKYLRWVSN